MRVSRPKGWTTSIALSLLLLAQISACGDDSAQVDSSVAGAGGLDGGSQAGFGGSGSGSTSVDDGGGGQAGTPGNVCAAPVIDAGDDDCRACAMEYCCMASRAGSCLSPPIELRENGASPCYEDFFKDCVGDCYSLESTMQPDAGSWELVAECVALCSGGANDAGADGPVFPLEDSPRDDLVECIVGSSADDPGVATGTPGPLNHACDLKTTCYHRSPCAELCFPSWR